MSSSVHEIAAAAVRLSNADIRQQIYVLYENVGKGDYHDHVLPILWPHISDILTVAEAGLEIAESLDEKVKVVYRDYWPGDLSPKLCQRFSELPQYAQASDRVKKIVEGLGYADVIGIFLAGKFTEFIFPPLGLCTAEEREFSAWIDIVLAESEISKHDLGIADFQQFAVLTKLLLHTHTPVHETFGWLNQSRRHLDEEELMPSDCDRLVQKGLLKTSDLAQTSVEVLTQLFIDDEFALQRISAFLTERNLSFGMRFLPKFNPKLTQNSNESPTR